MGGPDLLISGASPSLVARAWSKLSTYFCVSPEEYLVFQPSVAC